MARQFVWTPPRGEPVDLTDATGGFRVLAGGTRGLSSPPYRTVTDTYAGVAGTDLRAMQADAREFALGVRVDAGTPTVFRARWRRLVRALRPLAGDGVLTVTDEWGRARSITCRYTGGLEGEPGESNGLSAMAVARFVAFDPWWRGEDVVIDVGLGAPTNFFPIFPVLLSTSAVQGEFTVDLSDTDAPTFPLWTVTGPGSSLTLTNETTGRSIQVDAALADGETMVIDTRPGRQSVRRGDGTNLMDELTSDPALWPLVEGVNVVTALLANAGAASRIVGAAPRLYAGI